MESARVQQLIVDDRVLSYSDVGDPDGRAVVLVHGLFSGARSWREVVPQLVAAGYRVIVPDLRGHGASDKAPTYHFAEFAADLIALLDDLELDRVDLIGHSLGGAVVSRIAQDQPERVRSLVIEDAPPPPVPGDRYRGPGLRELPLRQRTMLLTFLTLRYRWVRRNIDLTMARAVLTEFRREDEQWWADLKKITAPTLILYGGPTSHVPGNRLEHMQTLIPDAHLVTLPVGHRVHNLATTEFVRLVRENLRRAE